MNTYYIYTYLCNMCVCVPPLSYHSVVCGPLVGSMFVEVDTGHTWAVVHVIPTVDSKNTQSIQAMKTTAIALYLICAPVISTHLHLYAAEVSGQKPSETLRSPETEPLSVRRSVSTVMKP